MKSKLLSLLLFVSYITNSHAQSINEIWLDDLEIKKYSEGIPGISAKQNGGGETMTMVKKTYQRGIGVQSTSVLSFLLNGNATEFSASVGVDDMGNKILKHQFYVLADGKILFEKGKRDLMEFY